MTALMQWETKHFLHFGPDVRVRNDGVFRMIGIIQNQGLGIMHTYVYDPVLRCGDLLAVHYLPLYSLN